MINKELLPMYSEYIAAKHLWYSSITSNIKYMTYIQAFHETMLGIDNWTKVPDTKMSKILYETNSISTKN